MVSDKVELCRCARNTGKLMNDISNLRLEVDSMKFGRLNNIQISNLKIDISLMNKEIQSLRHTCDLDTTHQEDTLDNISRQTSFITKMTNQYEFDVEKTMMLHNLGTIRDQIMKKLNDCSIE